MSLYNQIKMSRPFKLYRLQQIDSQLDALRLRQGEIEVALQDDTRIRQILQKVEDCKTEWAAAKKALHLAEDETQKQRIKIELTESALYGGKVRNPKELQDLQNESASLKRYLSVLEDRQIETMLIRRTSSRPS